jgi:hypothetical protein
VRRLAAIACVSFVGAVALSGCGGGDDSTVDQEPATTTVTSEVTITTTTVTTEETVSDDEQDSFQRVTAKTVEMWKRNWCWTMLGMTRDEIVEIMGEPNFVGINPEEHISWDAYEWQFSADFKLDGTAYVLKWIDVSAPQDFTALPCDRYRTTG